ncbi:HNH endonuclease [Streptomyces globisporus]|uniref:HNH endonuclease n=1 Tax=Streptomyces globisporus TaxID=1908 RepID=UPI00099C7438|nr:HNH endonuclease [Streptomyces globisporus]
MNEQRPEPAQKDEQKREGRRHVVEVSGGHPGRWTFDVLDQDRWSRLTEEEQKTERHRAIKRRQNRRRAQRKRKNGPRDNYTLVQIGDRDGWRCAICHSTVKREFRAPHPCSPSVHHLIEIMRGGSDTLDNVALAHLFCNSDSSTWGQKTPAEARQRLADRVLYGKHGPGRRDRVPDADAVALAADITGALEHGRTASCGPAGSRLPARHAPSTTPQVVRQPMHNSATPTPTDRI